MGEIYFYGMSKYFDQVEVREKLTLLAKVEQHTSNALQPLIRRYGLTPRPGPEMEAKANIWMEERRHLGWCGLMQQMADEYPAFVDMFKELEKQAPEEDSPALKLLTDHEIVLIEFANREIAGDPDSLQPVHRFINTPLPAN